MRAARRRPQMNVVQPAGFDGEVKMIAPITLEAVADAVIAERALHGGRAGAVAVSALTAHRVTGVWDECGA